MNRGQGRAGRVWSRVAAGLACCLMSTEGAWAQHLGQGMDDGISVWRVVAASIVCALVAIGAALVMKRRMHGGAALFRGNRASPRLTIVESLKLRSQIDLCIISCDGDELLIVLAPQGASLLRTSQGGAAEILRAGGT
jgi:hypothetical protein